MFRASSRPSSGPQHLPLVLQLERGGSSAVGRGPAGIIKLFLTSSRLPIRENSVSAGLNFVKFRLGIFSKICCYFPIMFETWQKYQALHMYTPLHLWLYFLPICLYVQHRLCSLRGAIWDRRKSWQSKYKCRAWMISLSFRCIIVCCKFVRNIQRKGVVLCKAWEGTFNILASSVCFLIITNWSPTRNDNKRRRQVCHVLRVLSNFLMLSSILPVFLFRFCC
jgi:hypothetical protein